MAVPGTPQVTVLDGDVRCIANPDSVQEDGKLRADPDLR